MNWKLTLAIVSALILGFLLNSCSCEQWFNNGCQFKETFVGKIFVK